MWTGREKYKGSERQRLKAGAQKSDSDFLRRLTSNWSNYIVLINQKYDSISASDKRTKWAIVSISLLWLVLLLPRFVRPIEKEHGKISRFVIGVIVLNGQRFSESPKYPNTFGSAKWTSDQGHLYCTDFSTTNQIDPITAGNPFKIVSWLILFFVSSLDSGVDRRAVIELWKRLRHSRNHLDEFEPFSFDVLRFTYCHSPLWTVAEKKGLFITPYDSKNQSNWCLAPRVGLPLGITVYLNCSCCRMIKVSAGERVLGAK